MNIFKYFGDKPNPELKQVMTGLPVGEDVYDKNNLNIFLSVFRSQVATVIRSTRGFLSDSIYEPMSSQHGAFERLVELIDQKQYRLVSITNASFAKDEFLINAEVHIPQPHGVNVLVNFKLGLCRDFVNLSKEESGLAEPVVIHRPSFFIHEQDIPDVLKYLRLERRYCYGSDEQERIFYQSPEGYFYEIDIKGRSVLSEETTFTA